MMDEIKKLKARIAELEELLEIKENELSAYILRDFEYSTGTDGVVLTKYTGSSKTVIIPERINDIPVIAIGDGVFRSAASFIESVTLPPTIKKLGNYLFCNCPKLSNICLDNIIHIGEFAFWYCRSLSEVTIPGTVRTIPIKCFAACAQLHSITICEGVKSIFQEAFSDTPIESITFPESLEDLRASAVYNCHKLSQITFLGHNTVIIGDNLKSLFPRDVVIRAHESSCTANQLRDAGFTIKPVPKSYIRDSRI